MDRIKTKKLWNNKVFISVFCAFIGIFLISVSFLTKDKDEINYKATSGTRQMLEKRLEEIISHASDDNSVKVLITMENEDIYTFSNEEVSFFENKSNPEQKIAGVMIVLKNTSNPQDLSVIKQAAATALDIPKSKIYIIGGNGEK